MGTIDSDGKGGKSIERKDKEGETQTMLFPGIVMGAVLATVAHYYVMFICISELCTGGDLEGYYEKEALITWTERYDIALQLAKGE
jgi:hypothetical protein